MVVFVVVECGYVRYLLMIDPHISLGVEDTSHSYFSLGLEELVEALLHLGGGSINYKLHTT